MGSQMVLEVSKHAGLVRATLAQELAACLCVRNRVEALVAVVLRGDWVNSPMRGILMMLMRFGRCSSM